MNHNAENVSREMQDWERWSLESVKCSSFVACDGQVQLLVTILTNNGIT